MHIETMVVPRLSEAAVAARIHRHWQDRPHTFWLDSGCNPQRLGRYSFLGTDPYATLTAHGEHVVVAGECKADARGEDPWQVLSALARPILERALPHVDVPFAGGMVGYLSYDMGQRAKGFSVRDAGLRLPDMVFGMYDSVVCLDHVTESLYLISSGLPEDGANAQRRSHARLGWLRAEVEAALAAPHIPPVRLDHATVQWRANQGSPISALQSTFTRGEYLAAVNAVLASIKSGDVDQVNLAQRFTIPTALTGPELYSRLRVASPAPFAGLLSVGDDWILSSSPERFVRIAGNTIETRPIKGTRPRGTDPSTDARNRHALLTSAKDEAEHRMIVEVECEELQTVCKPNTVSVPELMVCEEYATVFHLVSTVAGELQHDADRVACVRSLFPGGSITGRPKERSIEAIAALEPVGRGIYTGAMGYIGIGGNIDLNVAIRTLILSEGKAHFHVGGGIVAGSRAEDEYEETLDKAEGMVRALLAQ